MTFTAGNLFPSFMHWVTWVNPPPGFEPGSQDERRMTYQFSYISPQTSPFYVFAMEVQTEWKTISGALQISSELSGEVSAH